MAHLADHITDPLAALFFLCFPIAIGLLVCLVAFGIAWGGPRVGILCGMLGVAGGLVGLAGLLFTAPQLWWVTVVPLGVGAAVIRIWYHHDGPVTARRPRFGLRGMFVLILLVALMLGGIASEFRQTKIEQEVAANLKALPGGSGNNMVRWRFDRVHEFACLSPLDPNDFEFAVAELGKLSQLHLLQIDGQNLSPKITERVGRLTTLRSLLIQNLRVTNNDLQSLANLHDLEILDLDASQLTDEGLAHLNGLKRLRLLHLYDANQITPTAMARLRASLPRLDRP